MIEILFMQAAVDEIERELASDDHLGPWLCGPTFTAADICVTGFLLRLHQVMTMFILSCMKLKISEEVPMS